MITSQNMLFVVTVLFFLYVFWTDLRPVLQEWRDQWMDHESAARYFRDQLEVHPKLSGAARIFDSGSKNDATLDNLIASFSNWLKQGVDQGILEVRGTPVNGSRPIKVTEFQDSLSSFSLGQNERILRLESGTRVTNIMVKKITIQDYVQWLLEP